MTQIIEATPTFRPVQFFKTFIYHIVFYMLGPFSALIISCFETWVYIRNIAFIPSFQSSPLNFFFIIQLFQSSIWITVLLLFIRHQYDDNDDPEAHRHEFFPFLVLANNLIARQFIIGVRAGTTSKRYFLRSTRELLRR